jgi:hypothetical protein
MGFLHETDEQFARGIQRGHEAVEQLLGCQQDLVCRFAPTALAAHAVGENGEQTARLSWMRHDRNLVLLISPIAFVKRRACGQSVGGMRSAHVSSL